jgi:hypothetical protein
LTWVEVTGGVCLAPSYLLGFEGLSLTERFDRTGASTWGWAFNHVTSSDLSSPGVAKGVTRRKVNPWLFTNRFIDSSLNPSIFAISGSRTQPSIISISVMSCDFHPVLMP